MPIKTSSNNTISSTVTSAVTQRLQKMVAPGEQAVVLRVNPSLVKPPALRLLPYQAKVHRLIRPVQCHRLPFAESVGGLPLVHSLPMKYPVQTGQELPHLACKPKMVRFGLPSTQCHDRTPLLMQLPLRWSLITLDMLDMSTCEYLGREVRKALQHDAMASYWKTQGVYAPVYPNKVFKVLRHPSGYLIGLPGQAAEKPAVSRAHYVVWLSAGKTKSQLLWVPVEGPV
jgi:hypothetical protein